MARKKPDADAKASKSPSKKAPSVASFLSKISTPKGQGGAMSPAKGLLGDISKDDLKAVGRLEHHDDDLKDAPRTPDAGGVSVELTSREGEPVGPSGRSRDRTPFRHLVDVRGVFTGEVEGADGAPRTKDLSHGGVFVETAHLLEVGDPVVLSFPLRDGKRVVVNGRVRWVTPFGRMEDPTPGMGIEFVGLDAEKQAKLQRVLASSGETVGPA